MKEIQMKGHYDVADQLCFLARLRLWGDARSRGRSGMILPPLLRRIEVTESEMGHPLFESGHETRETDRGIARPARSDHP